MSVLASRSPARSARVGLAAALTAGLVVAGAALPAQASEEPPPSDITMVQANIYSGLSTERFRSDVREVLSAQPDFVTYNEVPLRQDAVIAPAGYAVHRSMKNRYTAATAVAWREDRWTSVARGTQRISNYRKIPPGRKVRLGLRFVNWVTLRSDDGRRLSVVSAHLPPPVRGMPDLLRPSVTRLNKVVAELAPLGPVLVGGDFNVHYRSSRYPRDLFDASGLVPTFDTLQSYFPTGDHRGATIDYVFNRGAEQLLADRHHPIELYSDHDAVVAGLSWQVDAPAETQRLVSDPGGDEEARMRTVRALADIVAATGSGSEVEVVTSGFTVRPVFRALKGAARRGVEVRLTTRSSRLTFRERRLGRVLETVGVPGSSVRRCADDCLTSWRESGMAPGFVLVRDAKGRPTVRVDVNRTLSSSMVERTSRMVVRTGELGLQRGEQLLGSVY